MVTKLKSNISTLNTEGKMASASTANNPVLGVLEWFRPGEYERVDWLLADLKRLGVTQLRTGFSWADWHTSQGQEWYAWLFPKLAQSVNILPCFHYTPPSLGIEPKTSAPPRQPKDFADFLDLMITKFGKYFEWVELWNEPNNLNDWDWRLDPEWNIFAEMIGAAAYWSQQRGKKTVLAGMAPSDANWLRRIGQKGVLAYIDAVGIHGFPGTWEFDWEEWAVKVEQVQEVLAQFNADAQVWITETGFSTWKHDEHAQLEAFISAIAAPVKRVYWYAGYDLQPDQPTQDGLYCDVRHYHMGLKRADGSPKLLYRLWADSGLDAVRNALELGKPAPIECHEQRPVLITGGAGFIGTNLAHRLLSSGRTVLIFDNLSRPGVEANLRWLREVHGDRVQIQIADIRDSYAITEAVQCAEQIFHLSAQVAVTTSLKNPIHDFEVNIRGTLNLLEAMRNMENPPPLVFTSTNKVYGDLQDIKLQLNSKRYQPVDELIRNSGISEGRSLAFHSPYGCSKGAADQYVLDYAHTFGLSTVVFRMSCIYGPHQFGTEDQGWVAHFLISAIEGQPICLYGDGMQVRDVLFVEDLVDAFLLAQNCIHKLSGQAFNIGGGAANTISLLELIDLIGKIQGNRPNVKFDCWRPGDQRYYVSDTSKFTAATGWKPQVNVRQGVQQLYQWLLKSRGLISAPLVVGRISV
ncbi:MAG: GDP-mannose 4,6-dehydratase [Mojavia pulchra JT2-VF2]|jgi:CDP-paratose 2-epimerase|uniref:GDP-mannose 4,6-dehydratase n=1 Tax=Mojavia pulchra JT2-VF2 TaxID=287848 RepID=A0A951PXB5_9NOST|nr:GDP-mannose 4,6-dehydratase [Mojavia pulchra JT2-VF2]